MSYFDIEPKKKRTEKQKSKEKTHYTYENGAHFKYIDLYKALINLVNTLPSERLGNDGIYFEEDEKENKDFNKTVNYYNNNNEILTDRKYKKITLSHSRNKLFIKKKQNLNPNRIIFKKDFFKYFINNSYNQNNLFSNYINNNPKHKEITTLPSYNDKKLSSDDRKKNIPFQYSFNVNKKNKNSYLNTELLKNKTMNISGDENKKNYLPKINTLNKKNNDFDKKKILLKINPNFLSTKFILKKNKMKL